MFLLTLSTGRTLRCTWLIGIFTLVVLGLACHLWGQDVEDLKSGVVKITAKVEGKTQVGTGFIVRLERGVAYIVTAAHVIEGDPKPQVAFHPRANEFLPAQTLGIEGGDPRGVALLIVKGGIPSETRSFSISTKAAVRGGESVTVIGFPGQAGTPWMVTIGTIGGRKGGDLTFSGVVGEGNSGGPLLQNGKVIGVITQMGTKVSYAIPIASARFAIEGWGVELTESDEALLPKEVTGEDGITMVLDPGGEFLMGKEKQRFTSMHFTLIRPLQRRVSGMKPRSTAATTPSGCRPKLNGKRLQGVPLLLLVEKSMNGLLIGIRRIIQKLERFGIRKALRPGNLMMRS